MEHKEEYRFLVKLIKEQAKEDGKKLRNLDIAGRLGYNPDYFSTLMGETGQVSKTHIDRLKAEFHKELQKAGSPIPSDPNNPIIAIVLAMLDDYTEKAAQQEGVTYDAVRQRLKQKARLILNSLDSWIDGVV